ncbi:MAG: hypothetical protein GY757_48655, partial [bacterium]|nr:hypothetical protein [bacterium]
MFREEPEYTGVSTYNEIELLKLARVAVYYTRHGERKKAITVINVMEREYGKSKYAKYVKYYRGVKRRLVTAERFYNRGRKYQGLQRKYRKLYRKYAFLSRKYAKKRRGQYAGTV